MLVYRIIDGKAGTRYWNKSNGFAYALYKRYIDDHEESSDDDDDKENSKYVIKIVR